MARLVAFGSFDVTTVDLNWYAVNVTAAHLTNNANVNVNGVTYTDSYRVQASDGFDNFELDLYGSGLVENTNGEIVGGTVSFIGEYNLAAQGAYWYAENISVSAAAIYNAALTSSNQDELALIQGALAGNDTIILSPFADRMSGYAGDDVITGAGGHDILSGGGGNDTFLDTAANMNGDTITDFGAGDKIVFSDATLTSFSYSLSGNTLSYSGGSLTLSALPAGHLVAQAAPTGGVQLVVAPHAVHNDFNGDGRSDVLLRYTSGTIIDWLGNSDGTLFSNHANTTYALPTEWKVAGSADFNGDGNADLILRNDNGSLTEWLGNASGGFAWNQASTYGLDAGWSVAATGDFNGDGRGDLALRYTNGTVIDWLGNADGTFTSNHLNATYALPTEWKIAGSGDFNGDGRSDLVLRNDNGGITEWLGTASGGFAWNQAANYGLDAGWTVAAVGDVNGDGRDDLVLHYTSGAVIDWLGNADGTFFSNHANATYSLPSGWNIAESGDYNGDGRADLLLRNDDGSVTEWLGSASGGFNWNQPATYGLDTNWHIF